MAGDAVLGFELFLAGDAGPWFELFLAGDAGPRFNLFLSGITPHNLLNKKGYQSPDSPKSGGDDGSQTHVLNKNRKAFYILSIL